MKLSNPWLGPLQRSYQSIKGKLLEELQKIKKPDGSPLITDVSEGNILVLMLSYFAGIGEVIHFYIDNMARETFFSTARRYDSLVKHGTLVDYHPKLATPAQCDVVFTRDIQSSAQPLTISRGMVVSDAQGNSWESLISLTMPAGTSQIKVPFIQRVLQGTIRAQVTEVSANNRILNLPTPSKGFYANGGIGSISITGETYVYKPVETFAYSKSDDPVFILTKDEGGNPYVQFGDGKFGALPKKYQVASFSAYVTMGAEGNIPPNSISGIYQGCSYSNMAASGGTNYESFNDLKRRVPLSVKTLGVAVTKQDYVDLALQIPEVAQAAAEYICGRKLNIYIAFYGDQPGEPSGLIQQVKTQLELHSPMNTWLNVLAATRSKMVLDIDVVGNPSYKASDIRNAIVEALQGAYPASGPIGGKVRLSDIYALIDNQAPIDYLNIRKFYVMPWPKAIFGNAQLFVSDLTIRTITQESIKYIVEFIDPTRFKIYPYHNITTFSSINSTGHYVFEGTLDTPVNVNYPEGTDFDIKLSGKAFQQGYKYEIYVGNINMDFDQPGYHIPYFDPESLKLNITETT